MEDRYEIRGKIGQGGIGSVHRAYDHKLKREIAIKRILTSKDDPTLQEEATKQLMVEAGALASLQHPHIVTVLDVGVDEQGPYVVMELISGKTLDEIIENSPVTWEDFREIAMQSLEALIAAQELDMIHSDLKPPNIMLTWLPSGTFQVKIVDFGLAVLVQNQSQEEIENMDTVFGSIFFMPPEQFERKTLDARSDLYSLGCCFYQALTGTYPFSGETGSEVMEAHLNHSVTPIQEVRGDIPVWACQWVMWLINRHRDDRPASAREALANFTQNDQKANPAMSQGGTQVKRPRLVIPGTSPQATIGAATSKISTAQTPAPATAQVTGLPSGATTTTTTVRTKPAAWRPSKTQLKVAAVAAIALLLVVASLMIKKRNDKILREYTYTHIIAAAAKKGVQELRVSGEELEIVLEFISNSKPNANLAPAYRALAVVNTTDRTNADTTIANFATNADLPSTIRQKLFEEVIAERGNIAVTPKLIQFSASAKDSGDAVAALDAISNMIVEQHAEGLLGVISSTSHQQARETAESLLGDIIYDSENREKLAQLITESRKQGGNSASNKVFDHLLELCKPKAQVHTPPQPASQPRRTSQPQPATKPQPTPQSSSEPPAELQPIIQALNSDDDSEKLKAIKALANASDEAAHTALVPIAAKTEPAQIQTQVIEALIQLNSHPKMLDDGGQARQRWLQIIWISKKPEQRKLIVDALTRIPTDWATDHLDTMSRYSDDDTKKLAQQALDDIEKRRKAGSN